MTIEAIVPAIVALISAVLYLVLTRAEAKQLALYAFAGSFLAFMLAVSTHHVHIGGTL